jgi:hypothetical protein
VTDQILLTGRSRFYSIAQLKDVKKARRQLASLKNPVCGYAMNWIDTNRHLFEKEVYFPAAVEIEVTDVRYAGLVESCFNRNILFVSEVFGVVSSEVIITNHVSLATPRRLSPKRPETTKC